MVFLYNFQLAWSGIPYISLASFRILSFCISYVTFVLNVERILNIRLGIGNFTLGNCPTCRPGAGSGTLHHGPWVWVSPFRTLPLTASTEQSKTIHKTVWHCRSLLITRLLVLSEDQKSQSAISPVLADRLPSASCPHPRSLKSASRKDILYIL